MVRFLHTADWQMGLKATQMGLKAREVREKRFETLGRIAKLARDEHVDFVLVAGDTFDAVDVDEGVVKRTVDLMNSVAPIPVYVLPGNHDLLGPGSVWTRPGWRTAGSHIHLLDTPAEVSLGEACVLYPCPLSQKRTVQDPTAWIPPRAKGDRRIRVGIAHGGLDILPRRVNFPIPSNRAEASGLDYLALGDWHGLRLQGRSCYPGTPEPTAFDEVEPGHVLLVDIPGEGRPPRIEPRSVAFLHWAEEKPEVSDPTDVRALEERVKALGAPSSLVLRVHPHLALSASREAVDAIGVLRQAWESTCFYLDWPEGSLIVPAAPEDTPPEGLLAEADAALAAKLAPDGADAIVIEEARALLRRFTREART